MMVATILVVDDDQFLLSSMERLLAQEGWTVVTAPNLGTALECDLEAVDVLLADYDLGRGQPSGVEVVRQIRGRRPDLPSFIYSGLAHDDIPETVTFALKSDLEGLLAQLGAAR